MSVIAIAARSKAPVRLTNTDPLLPTPTMEMNSKIGMTARSCAKSTEKLARPAAVVSLPCSERSSSTIAVDERARLAPIIMAAAVFWPNAMAMAVSSDPVSSTCRPPRPKTRRRMAIRRLKESWRPIRNSKKTMPNSAMPATLWASTMVSQ